MQETTIPKFDPAPEVTGGFAAAFMGTLRMDPSEEKRELALIKRFLADRLQEEMDKLLRAAKSKGAWRKELSQLCRGEGCSATSVDRASEIVAEADSFSTAAALFRLTDGSGAAEPEELAELDRVVEGAEGDDADFIKAGTQNLQKMIWPTREATFDMVRELLAGNVAAETALSGWESRAELKLILRSDQKAAAALEGLVHMEELRNYLELKNKDLEMIGLNKLMAGDKNAAAVMRKLTPSYKEKIVNEWKIMSKFGKFKLIFFVACGVGVVLMRLLKGLVADTVVETGFDLIVDIITAIIMAIMGVIAAAWFVLKGKPYRDKVVGPNPTGVELMQKVADNEVDQDIAKKAQSALQSLLMGQEPDLEGLNYLRKTASKYHQKVPEAKEALDCMENILVLQAAGKSTAKIEEFSGELAWPIWVEVWPPTKLKLMDALDRVKEKTKRFVFRASIHPWMKKYATCAGDVKELYQTVEIPLSMMQDNAEEFDALDKLSKGYRPDPAGLAKLNAIVEELCNLADNGPKATTLQEAMQENTRTGNVEEVFAKIDVDDSGLLSRDEFDEAADMLSEEIGFTMSPEELDSAWAVMESNGDGDVDLEEFKDWWKSVCISKKERKIKQQQQMTEAGLLPDSPRPKQLQLLLTILNKALPTIGLQPRAFEALEDMCPDDETFDRLQECFNLCELKRVMLNDKNARNAIVGLEAICMVPNLLKGNEQLGIEPNTKALKVLKDVKLGDKAAVAALEYLRQPEYRRVWGMLTERQRRVVAVVGLIAAYPALAASGMLDEFSPAGLLAGLEVVSSSSGSWDGDESWGAADSVGANATSGSDVPPGDYTNPSFYVLGLLPLVTCVFVNFFGQRVASVITLATVFVASAGATIAAALNDGTDEFTPQKFMGVAAGMYSGSVALKVASGNIKFAYGVQGASIGALVSRFSLGIWQPMILKLVPELGVIRDPALSGVVECPGIINSAGECLIPHPKIFGWVDLTVAAGFGAAAAWISNQYRNIISIFATAAIGTLGFVQTAMAYGIPGMENFTMSKLSSGGVQCSTDGCWAAGAVVLAMMWGGTMNQFKMESMDFSMPAISPYERFLAKIEKGMALIFAINEFIDKAGDLDSSELMEQCLAARDKMVKYAALATSLMQFSLCFGFFADFFINLKAGVFDAVPWVGVTTLAMAIFTPVMAFVGTVAGVFTQPQLIDRLLEVKVPPFVRKFFPKIFPIGRESFIIKFGPIGKHLQKISFYLSAVNSFVAISIVGISWLTAQMYRIKVLAQWPLACGTGAECVDSCSVCTDLSLEAYIRQVVGCVGGLGDSAVGLVTILVAGMTSTAMDLGGTSWLIVHLVEMENFFILGSGSIISGVAFKLGSDYPAGNYMFAPLGLVGLTTIGFGALQSVPWFSKKFPDLMFMLHKAQLVLCGCLAFMFVVMISVAREAGQFVEDNWYNCSYQIVCDATGSPNFNLKDAGFDKEGMEGMIRPMFYAGSMSCLSCLLMLVGGSNLAKYMYYQTILSRREEIAANKSGNDSVRHQALKKKVRGQRQAEVAAAAAAMRHSKVVELEEAALVMEFATGVAMEQHYDLIAHDEIFANIDKSAAVEAQLAAGTALAPPSVALPDAGELGDVGVPADTVDLQAAQQMLDAGDMSPEAMQEAAQKQKDEMAGAAEEEILSKRDAVKKEGMGMGVSGAMTTGASLESLARSLAEDGLRTDFHDAREDEKIPLKSRVKGAKELFAKTKEDNLAGWHEMDIHGKRTCMYEAMQEEVESGNWLPSIHLSNLFEKRL